MKKYFLILISFFSIAEAVYCQTESFERNQFIVKRDTLLYRFLKPDLKNESSNSKKYPLLIFLHGAGERGNDNELQLTHCKIFITPEFQKEHQCYVIAPQCPIGKRWVETDWTLNSHKMPESPSISMNLLIQLITKLISENSIDTSRIYVTGVSMGGFGTWDLICREPQIFAAAAPVCGGGDEFQAKKISNIPIWIFHGSNDKVVKVIRSRNMNAALKKAGGNPKYSEYPAKGHGIWTTTYSNKKLFDWMFSQKLKIK